MIMRVFISVELPREVKKEIKKIQAKLPEFVGKKTELENLHLTLKFLGEIDREKVEQVKKALKKVKLKKFEAELDKLGIFTPSFIKIVWVSLAGCNELQKQVDEALSGLFGKEKRFMSHVTIARVKNVKDKKKFLSEVNKIKFEKIKFKVDRFYLMESVLHEKGPEYRVIESYSLV